MCPYCMNFMCIDHLLFVHSSADGQLGCFHILVIGNYVAIHIVVQIGVLVSAFSYFVYIPISGIMDPGMFNLLRNYHSVFSSGSTILYSHHQYTRVPVSP